MERGQPQWPVSTSVGENPKELTAGICQAAQMSAWEHLASEGGKRASIHGSMETMEPLVRLHVWQVEFWRLTRNNVWRWVNEKGEKKTHKSRSTVLLLRSQTRECSVAA